MPTIYDLKPAFQRLLHPLCNHLARKGISPNQLTLGAAVLSIAQGLWLTLAPGARLALLVLLETFLMAAVGLLIGVMLGALVAGYIGHVGFAYPGMDELAAKFNMPSVIYPSVGPVSLMLGPTVVFVFCLFAAIYPALKLYGLRPVEAMRAI